MEFSYVDFLIGFLLMNAMPHMLFGLLGIRFLSLFGFSAAGNLGYAFLNVAVAVSLFHFRYGVGELGGHGIVLGAGVILVAYLFTGRFFFLRFREMPSKTTL